MSGGVWMVVLFVLVVVAGFVGWWWSSSSNIEKVIRPVKVSVSVGGGMGVNVASEKVFRDFVAGVPATKKPEEIRLTLVSNMPDSIEVLMSKSKDSTLGKDGVGVACGVPEVTNGGKTVNVKVYVTAQKLIDAMGDVETLKTLNRITRACLAWGVWNLSADKGEYSKLAGTPYASDDQPKLVELK
jgi:hypothetical protein